MKAKLILPATLVAIMVLALSPPAHGQGIILAVDPQIIDVTICSTFTVDIRIENIPIRIIGFQIKVTFDPGAMSVEGVRYMEYLDSRGWSMLNLVKGIDYISLNAEGTDSPWSENATWMTVKFHCKGAGTSSIGFHTDSWLYDGNDYIQIDFENSREASITQHARRAPRYSDLVGGVLAASNKLMIFAPYLTLIGSAVAVTTATIIMKRRREA